MKTMTVVSKTSRRVGQTTLETSVRTCWRNWTGFIVDINEVELASAFERELNLGDAVLVGDVTIRDDTDMANTDTYELTVSLENAKVVVPEGKMLVLSTDTGEAYKRLVEAFADGVVSRLK